MRAYIIMPVHFRFFFKSNLKWFSWSCKALRDIFRSIRFVQIQTSNEYFSLPHKILSLFLISAVHSKTSMLTGRCEKMWYFYYLSDLICWSCLIFSWIYFDPLLLNFWLPLIEFLSYLHLGTSHMSNVALLLPKKKKNHIGLQHNNDNKFKILIS